MSEKSEFAPRLDRIETRWSLVRLAHGGTMQSSTEARRTLVLRYSSAIRGYVGALTRNKEDSDEIAQDVVVRMLRGDFGGADPDRGRFRDLLKVAVRNMVKNHWDKSNRRKGVDHDLERVADAFDDTDTDPWIDQWRNNVMQNAWQALTDYEQKHPDRPMATVLQMRASFPEDTSQQMAERLSQKLGKPIRADSLRQQLRRARVRFAEYVVEEIADGLNTATPERIQEELIHLGLYEQIKDVLPDDWLQRDTNSANPSAED